MKNNTLREWEWRKLIISPFPIPPKNPMIFYVTKHGFTFAVRTNSQADKLEKKLAPMSYNQVSKFHRELYGATLPKNSPIPGAK